MNPSDATEAAEKLLSPLPYPISRHVLERLCKLTHHEPMLGIMGKNGAGKSPLHNALSQGKITLVSALMTVLPGHTTVHLMTYLQDGLYTEPVRTQTREQFTGMVDRILDTTESVYVASAVCTALRVARDTMIFVARTVWSWIFF